MIGLGGQPLTIYLATRPVDFRKGHDGLSSLVQETFGRDPFSGAVFVFRSKRAHRIGARRSFAQRQSRPVAGSSSAR
jgi:transposase